MKNFDYYSFEENAVGKWREDFIWRAARVERNPLISPKEKRKFALRWEVLRVLVWVAFSSRKVNNSNKQG